MGSMRELIRREVVAGVGGVGFSGSETVEEIVEAAVGAVGGFCLKVNGSTCREQTRRVWIPAERRNAQKSCAPRSREPESVVDARMKSALDISSVPDGVDHYEEV